MKRILLTEHRVSQRKARTGETIHSNPDDEMPINDAKTEWMAKESGI
jgi:hypothetical protein